MISDAIGRLYDIAKRYASWVGDNAAKLSKWVGDFVSPPLKNGSDPPYVPPFTGGQCAGIPYVVQVKVEAKNTGNGQNVVYQNPTNYTIQGAFAGVETELVSNQYNLYLKSSTVPRVFFNSINASFYSDINPIVLSVTRSDGLPDECGNLPNPNPSSPTQDNPIPDGGSPVDGTGSLVSNGDTVPPLDSLPTVDAAIPAATLAAIADAIGKVLGALKSLVDLANALKDLLDRLRKKEAKKELRVFGLGSVKGDGYLNFLPLVNQDWMPVSVEVFVFEKPSYLSKWFGIKSPNYYNSGLGSISFVDSTFCVRDGRISVNYIRSSFTAPSAAIGLYYHFGLTEKVSAQISILMEKNNQ